MMKSGNSKSLSTRDIKSRPNPITQKKSEESPRDSGLGKAGSTRSAKQGEKKTTGG